MKRHIRDLSPFELEVLIEKYSTQSQMKRISRNHKDVARMQLKLLLIEKQRRIGIFGF
jgi:hypothetical protein